MEQVELDVALEELELRLERLRALYEQYFMGLEKIEPQIARKDIDRRIYVLRREKIRNTAKRFKLQTIIQRYNTFQQYWMRICREIENGTYKRHLIKAAKQSELLTIAARKRLGRHGSRSKPPEARTPSEPPSAQPNAAPALAPATAAAAATENLATPVPAAAAAAAQPLGPPLPRRLPPPLRPHEAGPLAAPPAPAPPATAASPPQKPAPAKFESLDLDMDFMGDWDPVAKRAAPKPAAPAAKPAALAAAAAPAKPAAAAPAASRPASIPPAPVAVPPRPASSRPPTAPARPAASRIAPAARPLGAAPAPPPKPLAKPTAPAAAAASASVDDARMRDLHARLQQAKQQTKEANVSFEGLAKSIRAAEAKLREQHKNRKIDFDVVIKDGKAVVKPIVR